MVIGCRATVLATALILASAGRAGAQGNALHLFTHGGGYSALENVDDIGAELKTGFTLGGGVGYEIHRNLELRLALTGAQSQLVENGVATGVYLNRYFLAADLKVQYPIEHGITPYGLVGAGVVLLHEKGSTDANKNQGFVHLGGGLAYSIGKSGFAVFAQGDAFSYSLSEMTSPNFGRFSKIQIDLGWTVGASYRLPL